MLLPVAGTKAECSAATGEEQAAMRWLTANARPLRSLTPDGRVDDLEPLRAMLQGVDVVGLGEASHGSREFHTVRHRLVEYLVTKLGYRVLAFESPLASAFATEDYVLSGQGSPEQALTGLVYWVWRTAEVQAMLEWIRAYNQKVPDDQKVHVVAFDIQSPNDAGAYIHNFLARVAPAKYEETKSLVTQTAYLRTPVTDADERARTAEALRGLVSYAEAEQVKLALSATPDEARRFVEAARHLARGYELMSAPGEMQDMVKVRDRLMAQTVQETRQRFGEHTKVMLYAHNGHIWTGQDWMGQHLRQALGDRYYALGAVFAQGRANVVDGWSGLVAYRFPGPVRENGTWSMVCARVPDSLIDLRQAAKDATLPSLLTKPQQWYFVGAVLKVDAPQSYQQEAPLTHYDGVFYLNRVEPATPAR